MSACWRYSGDETAVQTCVIFGEATIDELIARCVERATGIEPA